MKKLIVFIVTAMFVVSAAGLVLAQRSLDEERDAVRAYLKVVDTKIINYRKTGDSGALVQIEKFDGKTGGRHTDSTTACCC